MLLRFHRAGCRIEHHAHQDVRAKGSRGLSRARPEGLDLDRAGRQQDHAVDADHASSRTASGRPTASRSSTPTSTAARSRCAASRRWAARRSIRMPSSSTGCLSRMPTGSARKGKGFSLHPAQPEPRAPAGRGRGDRDRPGRAAPGGEIRARAHRVRPARSARTRASSIRSPSAGWRWRRPGRW